MSPEGRQFLLQLARHSIASSLGCETLAPGTVPHEVSCLAGCFVTLRRSSGELRGCIGTFNAETSLATNVRDMALAAASRDPRFPPVQGDELGSCVIEISALSPKTATRPDEVRVGEHGLWVERGTRRGVLLPQVATEHGWDRETFLRHTCLKAGLPPDAWRDAETQVAVFSAEVFGEGES